MAQWEIGKAYLRLEITESFCVLTTHPQPPADLVFFKNVNPQRAPLFPLDFSADWVEVQFPDKIISTCLEEWISGTLPWTAALFSGRKAVKTSFKANALDSTALIRLKLTKRLGRTELVGGTELHLSLCLQWANSQICVSRTMITGWMNLDKK